MTDPRFPQLTLDPLRWWDIPAVAALEAELFVGDSPWNEAMFWSELAQRHHYLVAWDGNQLVGYAGLGVFPDAADIQTIAVRPTHQHAGLGRRLLMALLALAGGLPVGLEVRTDNEAAIGLYSSLGFERTGLRRHYYQPSGADAYTMVRIPV